MDKNPKSLTMYIPSNLSLDELIKANPLPKGIKRDHLVYICNLITDLPTRSDDKDMLYVPLYSKLLQKKIRNYKICIKYLVENGILLESKQYIPGRNSRGYRFSQTYQSAIKSTLIKDKCLIKAVLKFHELFDKTNGTVIPLDDTNTPEIDYLTKWFDGRLTVDLNGAKECLELLYLQEIEAEKNIFQDEYQCGNARQRYNRRLLPLLKIQNMDYICTIDKTAGRLHTVLTQVKSILRGFIKYNGKQLVAVDICNSQPYLALSLLNDSRFEQVGAVGALYELNPTYAHGNFYSKKLQKAIIKNANSENTRHYRKLVATGNFYEDFASELSKDPLYPCDGIITRAEAKEIMFSAFFSPNRLTQHVSAIKIFKRKFPDIFEIFSLIKLHKHNTLACLLQSIEAKLVLHTACKIISEEKPDLPIFTLHDSIITTEGNEEYVKTVLSKVLLDAIGEAPTLKFEYWKSVG